MKPADAEKGEPPMEKSNMEDLLEALEASQAGFEAALFALSKSRKTLRTLGRWLEKYGSHLGGYGSHPVGCTYLPYSSHRCSCGWNAVLDVVKGLRQTEKPTEKAQGETDDRSS